MELNRFAVIGVGKYGASIARALAEKGAQVFAFDADEEKIEDIKDDVAFAVTLDSTDKKTLISQNITDVDAVVVAIGENFEATVLTCAHLLDLNCRRIIARASGDHQRLILTKIGIEEILTPEHEVAFLVREKLINPSIVSFLQLPDDYEIAEIKAPKRIVDRPIGDIDFRNDYQLTLVTLKREFRQDGPAGTEVEEHVIGVPSSDTMIKEHDTLVVFGTASHVAKFLEINQ